MTEGAIEIRAVSFESLALPHPLRFRPPLVEWSRNPDKASTVWQWLTYVFDLPNPYTFPKLEGWTEDELHRLERFTQMARRVAGGELISGDWHVTIRQDQDGTHLVRGLPSDELMTGFATMFRQLSSDKERASYPVVHDLLYQRARAHADAHRDERLETLTRWGRTHRRLLGTELTVLVGQKLIKEGKWRGPMPGEDVSPRRLISQYNYGDLIHWDEHAAFMRQLSLDPFREASSTLDFIKCCNGLCHLYFGAAVMVAAAAGLALEGRLVP